MEGRKTQDGLVFDSAVEVHSWRIEVVWTGVLVETLVGQGGVGEEGVVAVVEAWEVEEAVGNSTDLWVEGLGFELVVGIGLDH